MGTCTHEMTKVTFTSEVQENLKLLSSESVGRVLAILLERFPDDLALKAATSRTLSNWRLRNQPPLPKPTVEELKDLLENMPTAAEDEDEPFILKSEVDDEGKHFHVVLTTKKLLENALQGYGPELVLIDGMFKVARETCDKAHKGLVIGVCVTTGERKRAALDTLNAIWLD